MLNEKIVLEMMQPYLNSHNELSEFEFNELFSELTLKEQYEIINIMIRNDIDYVEIKEEEQKVLQNAAILQDNHIACFDYKPLMKLNNEELCVMYQRKNDAALSALIEKNKKFVYQMACKIYGQYRSPDLTIEDLYQEGNLGLIKAARKFQISLDNKFITYCWHWVRQSICRAVMNDGFLIRIPVHVFEKLLRINRCRKENPGANIYELQQIINEEGIFPNPISMKKLQLYVTWCKIYLNTVSLNTLVGDKENSELMEFIPAQVMPVEEQAEEYLLKEDIKQILTTVLTPRESAVLQMRFGIMCEGPETLEKIGVKMHVTRERIRQIESKAILKLQRIAKNQKMSAYLGDK